MKKLALIFSAGLPLWLAGCAIQTPPATVAAAAPPGWYAPLPHNGTLTDLSQWWRSQGDPLLSQLIDAAQAVSPTIASAKSRIEQSRAVKAASAAALLPSVDGSLGLTRGRTQADLPVGAALQGEVKASWEVDLFGANRAGANAAQARLEGAQAGWHEARVSVAAEVANQYYSLRSCDRLLAIALSDATSRAETARLSQLSAEAGFAAPATTALARASAAEANGRATQQRALCDLDIKALVALTARPEPELRQQLTAAPFAMPQDSAIAIASLPAQILAQRPDVFAAEREVAAASAEVGSAEAQRYPRLSLNGALGATSFRSGGVTTNVSTWSIGPVAVSLPIFDGGKRAADIEAAKARYEEAAVKYRASVRQAVREVEEALVNLHSTGARSADAVTAAEGYRASFAGTESRYTSGLANLPELEEARRTRLAAETALASLQRERVAAWIALYRAAGGGWRPAQAGANATTATTATP